MGHFLRLKRIEANRTMQYKTFRENLDQTLKALPVEPPEEGFFDTVVEETVISTHRNESRFRATAGIGGVIAAGLVVWLVLALPTGMPGMPESTLETVTISMNVEKTFRISFESKQELQAAAISVELPEGVEVVGYEGRDSVRWTTTIQPGTNILKLPLVVRSGVGGGVVARVEHEGKEKTFAFAVKVI